MNTTPTNKVTEDRPVIGPATARLLLQHALETEKQNELEANPDLARKRAINDLTGASIRVAPKIPAETQSAITTKLLEVAVEVRTNSAYD